MVESLQQCVVAIDGSATVEGSGGIEQAMKAVAQECWQFLSMHGGRFSCMQALETKLLVYRVDAVRVLEMFGGIRQFPHAQQVAQILSHGVPVRLKGNLGPEGRAAVFESQLYRSVHRTLCDKGSEKCSARASFYFPARDGFAYSWVQSVSRFGWQSRRQRCGLYMI